MMATLLPAFDSIGVEWSNSNCCWLPALMYAYTRLMKLARTARAVAVVRDLIAALTM